MPYYRNPYDQRGFFFGVPFLGGLVGSAVFFPRPRPFYPPFPPYPPYGGYGGYGFMDSDHHFINRA
ncbi:hypothetical protein ACE38V_12150 [Cytobacillus sp. Hz8]|uniref:hypothetical protein n=1 Tax=Cytobacillus sp. Hz8 TaxID=3347168 RepID=UPI0035E0FF0A